jgi:dipeptide/tripeptide permease
MRRAITTVIASIRSSIVGINIGAFQAPPICGTLGEEVPHRARQATQYHWRDYEVSAGFIRS